MIIALHILIDTLWFHHHFFSVQYSALLHALKISFEKV